MPHYAERWPVGTSVRIAQRPALEHFRATWAYHHRLTEEQLAFAGRLATVRSVGFYHGGDVLYELDGVSGTWHESCLADANERAGLDGRPR